MRQAMVAAKQAVLSQQLRVDAIANNVANVSTTGFKSTRVDFKDSLYSTMDNPVLDNDMDNNLLCGSGVSLDATNIDFTQGADIETGQPLDFAIEGDGFFQVLKENGEVIFTRSGSFNTAAIDGVNYLVTPQGYFVLDSSGNKIMMPETGTDFSISEKGIIGNDDGEFGTIGLFQFTNPNGLSAAGDTSYTETAASGAPVIDENSTIVQGKLENSNVDLAQELTLLIRSQRAYSLASRALTTSDEMLGLANNMH
jgi:flagellar basal-body rod protein FlgG